MFRTDAAFGGFRDRRFAIGLVLLTALLAGCGSQSGAFPAAGGDDAGAISEDAAAAGERTDQARDGNQDAAATSQGGPEPGEMFAAPAEQRIVKTGEISIEVERVATALARVRTLALELGGYVGDSQAGTLDESATLTLRIPASRFAEALTELRELDGEVLSEATREEDVTSQIVDLEARIANLEASEASYRILLERAERIDDVLAVQLRLDDVRGQIEQLKAQLENVTGRADLSTLTVTLVPRAEPVTMQAETWDPRGELDRAIASLVAIGQGLLTGLIWFVVVWLPMLLVLALFALLALRGVLELRRRLPTGPPVG